MALRAVTLTPAARRLTLSKDGWRKQVETTLTHAKDALRRDDLETVAALFAELETWGDEQRAYQACRQLTEVAFTAADSMRLERWIDLYLVVAGKLLDRLERSPS